MIFSGLLFSLGVSLTYLNYTTTKEKQDIITSSDQQQKENSNHQNSIVESKNPLNSDIGQLQSEADRSSNPSTITSKENLESNGEQVNSIQDGVRQSSTNKLKSKQANKDDTEYLNTTDKSKYYIDNPIVTGQTSTTTELSVNQNLSETSQKVDAAEFQMKSDSDILDRNSTIDAAPTDLSSNIASNNSSKEQSSPSSINAPFTKQDVVEASTTNIIEGANPPISNQTGTESKMIERIVVWSDHDVIEPNFYNEIVELPDNWLDTTLVNRSDTTNVTSKPLNFSFDIYGGVSYLNKNLSLKNSGTQDYLDLRNASEQPLIAYQFGGIFNLHFKHGLGLSVGLQRTSFIEKLNYSNTLVDVEMIEGVIAEGVNIFGDSVQVMGQIPQTTTTVIQKRFYNKYNFLELPIMLSL